MFRKKRIKKHLDKTKYDYVIIDELTYSNIDYEFPKETKVLSIGS